jgi:alpha-glucosidase (family GH31 glycosyl hydrolase)
MGPVKQYTAEAVDGPLSVTVYPGADGAFELFEDDGTSFAYRSGDWMGVRFRWNDRARQLSVELTPGSKMRPPLTREISVRLAGSTAARTVRFSGRRVSVALSA